VLSPIDEVLEELRQGRMVVLVDDERRENEGDLVQAAQHVTPEAVNFMLAQARGYLCLALTGADCDRLDLRPQAEANTSLRQTAFTVTIDAAPRHGVTTGVSAVERARTIQLAIDPSSTPADFVRPGHVNPLRARDGGVLVRAGQTEGSVDLCRMAGLAPAAVIIEIMREDGRMARLPDLERFCAQHNLKMCSVAQIIERRLATEPLVRRLEPRQGQPLLTEQGRFTLFAYESLVDPQPHIALTTGGVGALDETGAVRRHDEPVLVRVHRRHVLGDVFGAVDSSDDGPTGAQLRQAMQRIQQAGAGAVVYLRTEEAADELASRLQRVRRVVERGADAIDFSAPSEATGVDTPMELRTFGVGGQILRDLGLARLRLLTNHPKTLPALEAFGLEIVEQLPLTAGGGA